MKARCFALLTLVMMVTVSNYAFARILESPTASVKPEFYEPREIVEIYFKAVSRGELIVFNREIDKSMLIPVRVEYVYELNNAIPRVKVYSELKQPTLVPDQKNCKLRGISAVLSADGRIIETEAHIWPE